MAYHGNQELEFLADSSVITPQQLSSILSQLPEQTQLDNNARNIAPIAQPTPAPAQPPVAAYSPPTNQFANTSLNEKAPTPNQYPTPAPPPPAYAQTPAVLSTASALYAYTPTDAGDLALQPHDRIQVLEHMNNDCMTSSTKPISCRIINVYYRVARSQRADRPRGYLPSELCECSQ